MKMKQRLFLLIFVFGVLSISLFLPQYILSSVPSAQAVLPVQATYTPYISCSGTLQAGEVKEVYALYPVMVEEVYVRPGDWVETGDILAKIDIKTTLALAANQNDGGEELKTIEQYRELAEQYGVEDKLDQYIAQQTISSNSETYLPTEEEIKIRYNGRVLLVNCTPGCLSEGGQQLYTISTSEKYTLVLQVEEQDSELIKEGDQVVFFVTGQEKTPLYAEVTQIAPVVIQENNLLETNTYVEVWAQAAENSANLRPGATVQAKIATSGTKVLTAVPYSAVSQDEQNREFVYQIENGKPVVKYIEVAKEESRYVYVSSGVNHNQPIFLNAESLDPNCRYRIEYQEENDV